jgi:GAF domain-containing protein
MQRRGGSGQPGKGQRRAGPKARKTPTSSVSADHSLEQFDRLRRERDEALERETATSEVLRIISNSPTDLQSALGAIAESAARLLDVAGAEISRVEGDGLRLMAKHGAFPQRPVGSIRPINRDWVTGRAVVDRTTVQVLDLQAAKREFPEGAASARQYGHRTTLATPLLREGTPIGAILIRRMEVRPFSDKQIALLQNFAAQAVIAIENARLLSELRESLQQQTATADVLKVISSSPGDLEPVFQSMMANAVRICEAKFGTMVVAEEEGYRVVAMHGAPQAYAEERGRNPVLQVGPTNPLARVAVSKELQHIADIRLDQAYLDGDPAFVGFADLAGARTLLMVPMLMENKLIGAIAIYRQEVRNFTDKQIELVSNFAAQAVIAIENTRLLSELRESLQRQTATAEVLKVISSSPGELEPVFKAMLEKATRVCEANFGIMFRFEDGTARPVALLGVPQAYVDFVQRGGHQPSEHAPVMRVAKTKQVVHVADFTTERAYKERNPMAVAGAEIAGIRTLLVVPMLKDNKLVGAIAIYRQEVRPFSEKQIELVQNFANQAVIAIENTRLLNELRESLQQQTATADVLKVISRSTFDLQVVLDTLVGSAAQLCHADKASIRLLRDGLFHHVASFGYTPEQHKYMNERPIPAKPDRGSIAGRVLIDGKAAQIEDTKADPEFTVTNIPGFENVHTTLGVPLLREGKPIGVLVLMRSRIERFTEKQVELVTTFADQAVIAIENVRLFDEVQARTRELSESLEQQTATSEVLGVISSSAGELEPVFQTLLGNATRLCMADFGFMFQHKDGFFQLMAQRGADPAYVEYMQREPLRPGPETLLGRIAKSISPVQIADFASSQAYLDRDPLAVVAVERGGVRTLFGVPMLREGELIGAIALYRQEVSPFTEKQIDLLTNFAAQAVIAIENTRLLNELRESLQQQTATADVLKVISRSTFNLQAVLDTLLESASRLCSADKGGIMMREVGFGPITVLRPMQCSTRWNIR